MTMHFIPCHSSEIAKAWQMDLDNYIGFIRCRADGTYQPLTGSTLFYSAFEVFRGKDIEGKDYVIHWDKAAKCQP